MKNQKQKKIKQNQNLKKLQELINNNPEYNIESEGKEQYKENTKQNNIPKISINSIQELRNIQSKDDFNYQSENIEGEFDQINQEEENVDDGNMNFNEQNNNNMDINELKGLDDESLFNQNNEMEGQNNEEQNAEYEEIEDNNENNQVNEEYNIDEENLDENIKAYIKDLQNKLYFLANENNKLKVVNAQLINNNNNYMNMQKNKNFLLQQIKELQAVNKKLNIQLIQIRNRMKFLNSKYQSGQETELLKYNTKITEYEMLINKLKLEKNLYETKIENLKKDHDNDLKLMTNLKNNELQSYRKEIFELKNKFRNDYDNMNLNNNFCNIKTSEDSKFYINKINILEQNNSKLAEEVFLSEKECKNLKNAIENNNLSLKYKDTIIQTLNEKIKNFSNEYNRHIDSLEKVNYQCQEQVKKVLNERDELLKQNNDLNEGIKRFNNKLKETFEMFNKKNQKFSKVIKSYMNKLKEYKEKIIVLKKRIKELLENDNFSSRQTIRRDKSAIMNIKKQNFYI